MTGLLPAHAAFLDRARIGVLGTLRPGGGLRQSVVYYVRDGERLLVSTESKRAKARDVNRTGRASLCVLGCEPPFPSLTVEGPARIVTESIGDATARIMSVIVGAPVEDIPSDAALRERDRVVLELTAARVYGASHLPEPDG